MDSTSASLLQRLAGTADDAAWVQFVALYTPLLRKWCARLGLSDADACDFTQEVFVGTLRHLPEFRYDPARSFRAWLKTVLTNAWRVHRRAAARQPPAGGDPDRVPTGDPSAFVDESEHNDFLVRQALALAQVAFEPKTWKACWEFVVNDRPAVEVAADLGISTNAVYLAKSRALGYLRAELAGILI